GIARNREAANRRKAATSPAPRSTAVPNRTTRASTRARSDGFREAPGAEGRDVERKDTRSVPRDARSGREQAFIIPFDAPFLLRRQRKAQGLVATRPQQHVEAVRRDGCVRFHPPP